MLCWHPNLDEGVDKAVSLRPAEEPDGALLDDVVVDPARHGDGPRAAGDDHVGQEEALGQISTRKDRGCHREIGENLRTKLFEIKRMFQFHFVFCFLHTTRVLSSSSSQAYEEYGLYYSALKPLIVLYFLII